MYNVYYGRKSYTQCHDEWDILLVQPKETVRKMFYPSFFIVNRKVTIVNCSLFTLRMILFYTDELNQRMNEGHTRTSNKIENKFKTKRKTNHYTRINGSMEYIFGVRLENHQRFISNHFRELYSKCTK